MTHEVVNPDALRPPRGWNHGMLAPSGGRLLFVAGQTGVGDGGRERARSLGEEWGRALSNVLEVVREAGGRPEDVGRFTIYVTDRSEYLEHRDSIGEAYREVMGRHYPAIALVEVAGLVDEGARVEIEATAVIP